MSLWGNRDLANNAPKFQTGAGVGVAANGEQQYANTLINGYVTGIAQGVDGVTAAEAGDSIISITLLSGANGYVASQTDFINFIGGGGSGASARFTTNTRSVNAVVLLSGGSGYRTAPTAYANTANATNATFTVTVTAPGTQANVDHAGWVQRTQGTGSLTDITITAAGAGYNVGGVAANGFIAFTGGGGAGANAQWFSNAVGNITSVSIRNTGAGYNAAPTASIANTNTSIATFSTTVGGRAGRVTQEVLVAMGSLT